MTLPLDTQPAAAEAGGLPLHSTLAVSQQTTPPRLQTSENAPAQGHRVGWLRESGQGNRACFRASFASLQAQDTPQSPPGHQDLGKTSNHSYRLLLSGWPTIDAPQVSYLFIALFPVRILLGPAQDVGIVLPILCAFLFDHEVMPAIQSQSFVIHQASSTTTLDSMTVPPERSVRTLPPLVRRLSSSTNLASRSTSHVFSYKSTLLHNSGPSSGVIAPSVN